MQLTKFFLEAKTIDERDICLDFMQIDSYEPVTTDEKGDPLVGSFIKITMNGGDVHTVIGDMRLMKIAGGQIGTPYQALT